VPSSGGDPIRLTNHKALDDQAQWAPDSRSIAFVSAREGAPQVYRLSLPGGEPEKLTETKAGVQGFGWSPDGTRLAYVTQRDLTAEEEAKQKGKDDAIVIGRDWISVRLVVLDLASRKTTEVARAESIMGLDWAPDGKQIAYTVAPSPKADDFRNTDIMVADVATQVSRKLLDNAGPDMGARWSPDGQWIAFLTKGARAPSITQSRIAVIAAGGGTPRPVGGDFLYEPGELRWSRDGAALYFWASKRTRSELFRVAVAGGAPTQLSDLQGTTGLFGAGAPSISADESMIAYNRSAVDTPDEVTVARLQGAWSQVALTRLNPQLASVTMGKGEVMRWKSKDGMEIEGIVVYPVGYEPGKRYPTVAIIHGGPSGVWGESFGGSWYNSAQVYASNGWVSFLPNVRGSSAYGEKFLAANYRDWGNGDYQDIQTGLDHLVRRGIADSTRLAQSGWSYGGYMTAWTLTQTNRFKAVMVGAGLTNMYSMYSTNDLQSVLEDYFGGEPWDDEQAYRRASAMMSIKKAKTPTLILHGQVDTRVPIGQAQELYMGLKKNDVPVELVFFPREPHGLQEPRHAVDKIRRELAYFSRYVLGKELQDKVVQ
jgi:dipeptidyl aminopeptidase/acylaminoacyl peptidase